MERFASQGGLDVDPMAIAIEGGQLASDVVLPGRLDLSFANELHARLVARAGQRTLTLDASDVDYLSTPCVQILLAAGRKRDLTDCIFLIRDASDAFRRAVDEFGLRPEFSKWMN